MNKILKTFGGLLACLFLFGTLAACAGDDEPVQNPEGEYVNTQTLAYVPIDDRPVNVDRVQYLCASLEYTLVMPEADLYQTHLDNQKKNSNGTQYGDRVKLLEWLKETKADCYVLSLDQMLSGGLVQSRVMTEDSLDDTYEMIDELINAVGDKPAVMFDSVMRLASTVGYYGYEMSEYNALRTYGAVARKQLTGTELTIENIIAGYRLNAGGEPVTTTLSETVVDHYFSARERKLRVSDYYLKKVAGKANFYTYYGVDDSSPKITVQTNEINYLKGLMKNSVVFSGLDELGLMGVTKLYLNNFAEKPKANVTYYGGGADLAADDYDTGTLKECVNTHLATLGVEQAEDAPLQIAVLTKPNPEDNTIYTKAVSDTIAKIKSCAAANTPIIVIDADKSGFDGKLQPRMVSDTPLAMVLGYSNWNTSANTVGIALSNGLSRYAYLKNAQRTEKGNEGFLKTLAYSYVKDMSYKIAQKPQIDKYIRENIGDTSNFYSGMQDESALNAQVATLMDGKNACSAGNVLKAFNQSEYLISVNNALSATHGAAAAENYRFPWYRTFELTFDVKLAANV